LLRGRVDPASIAERVGHENIVSNSAEPQASPEKLRVLRYRAPRKNASAAISVARFQVATPRLPVVILAMFAAI
jgi:hypothetical protein